MSTNKKQTGEDLKKKEEDRKKFIKSLKNVLGFDISNIIKLTSPFTKDTPLEENFNKAEEIFKDPGSDFNKALNDGLDFINKGFKKLQKIDSDDDYFENLGKKFKDPDTFSDSINNFADKFENIFNTFVDTLSEKDRKKFKDTVTLVKGVAKTVHSLAYSFIKNAKLKDSLKSARKTFLPALPNSKKTKPNPKSRNKKNQRKPRR